MEFWRAEAFHVSRPILQVRDTNLAMVALEEYAVLQTPWWGFRVIEGNAAVATEADVPALFR